MSSEVFSNGTYAEVAESGGVYVTAGEEETQEPDPSCNTTRESPLAHALCRFPFSLLKSLEGEPGYFL